MSIKGETLTQCAGPGYGGLLATKWDPMGARAPVLSQMITQTHPTADRQVSEKFKI